ncbi:MAG TPA: hypothetical protein DIC53_11620 [Synergistaceae bacterium]|nr:hypothetical protein [Synergistaceae bacterium]
MAADAKGFEGQLDELRQGAKRRVVVNPPLPQNERADRGNGGSVPYGHCVLPLCARRQGGGRFFGFVVQIRIALDAPGGTDSAVSLMVDVGGNFSAPLSGTRRENRSSGTRSLSRPVFPKKSF